MPKPNWYTRIDRGEVKACPICGSRLVKDEMLMMYECVGPSCGWNDDLADKADRGVYVPPPGWRVK